MKSICLCVTLVLIAASSASAQTGRWRTESGNLDVEIAPCEEKLCGTVVKVLANRSMSQAGAEIAEKPALGLKILSDFASAGGGQWEGQIFNRENGKTYSCVISLLDADQLEVRPYIGIHLIGKTQVWRRVAADEQG
jgi:uncharacterized protein (DUF2147 family)